VVTPHSWNALPPSICDINSSCDYMVFTRHVEHF